MDFAANRQKQLSKYTDTGWDEVATFIGENAHRFEATWTRLHDAALEGKFASARSWCWPAFFFSFAWYFYRKQWAAGIALLMLPIIMGFVLPASHGAAIGISVAIGMLSKQLYIGQAVNQIDKIKARHAPGPERDNAIAAAGGFSVPAGVIGSKPSRGISFLKRSSSGWR